MERLVNGLKEYILSKRRSKRQFRQGRHLKRREKAKRTKQKQDTIPLEYQTVKDIEEAKKAKGETNDEA